MTMRTDERAAGIEELRRAGSTVTDPTNTIGWRNWLTWCQANARPELPALEAREQQLLLFLLHNHEQVGWARDTCANYARDILRAWPSVDGTRSPDTDAMLRWIGKQPRAARRTSGSFEPDQVLALGAALQVIPTLPGTHLPGRTDVAVAALLALADITGVSPLQRRRTGRPGSQGLVIMVWGQPASAFDVCPDRIVFTYAGTRHVVTRQRNPEHFHAISRALALAAEMPGDQPPLVKLWPMLIRPSGSTHKSAVLNAWVRATAPRGGQDPRRQNIAENRHAFVSWWDDADTQTRAQLIRFAGDRELGQRTTDLAYFYTGITTALRHATLCRLTLDEVEERTAGLVLHVPPTKHKSGNADLGQGLQGEWLHKPVAHQPDGDAGCVDHCPACALSAYVSMRRTHGADGRDLLFPPLHADADLLSRPAGTAALRRVWALAEAYLGNPDREVDVTIGTRSLRVSAATLARVAKMPLSQIQQLLDHRDPGVTELYIRIHDPYADEDLVLTVRPPAALAPESEPT